MGCKWLFKIKKILGRSGAHNKVRLVAQGFSQAPRLDYHESFSLVVKANIVRIILALAMSRKWKLRQVDVNNAFLNGDLDEVIYMKHPPGFEVCDDNGNPLACRSNKALYGLKQALKALFEKLRDFLIQQLQFQSSKVDLSLFFKKVLSSCVFIIVTGDDCSKLEKVIQCLNEKFSLKDLGELSYFLGLEIHCHDEYIHVSQQKYAQELLKRANMANAKPMNTPMVSSPTLIVVVGSSLGDDTLYRQIVGSLKCLCLTKPDIVFDVNKVSQYVHQPHDGH